MKTMMELKSKCEYCLSERIDPSRVRSSSRKRQKEMEMATIIRIVMIHLTAIKITHKKRISNADFGQIIVIIIMVVQKIMLRITIQVIVIPQV